MNADDKRLLRKFITQRVERTKATLAAVKRRRITEISASLDRLLLTDLQETAVQQWNAGLALLATAANNLQDAGLSFDNERSPYYHYSDRDRIPKNYNALSFSEHPIDQKVTRSASAVAREINELDAAYNAAIKALDATVDEALLDLLSQDLPGVRESLDKLSAAFTKAATDFGALPGDFAD